MRMDTAVIIRFNNASGNGCCSARFPAYKKAGCGGGPTAQLTREMGDGRTGRDDTSAAARGQVFVHGWQIGATTVQWQWLCHGPMLSYRLLT